MQIKICATTIAFAFIMQVLTFRSCSAVCGKQASYCDRFALTVIPLPKRRPTALASSRWLRPQSCCCSWLRTAPNGSLTARPSRISCRAIELATVNAVAAAATLYTVPFFLMVSGLSSAISAVAADSSTSACNSACRCCLHQLGNKQRRSCSQSLSMSLLLQPTCSCCCTRGSRTP